MAEGLLDEQEKEEKARGHLFIIATIIKYREIYCAVNLL
jgi:hypothetical protein